MLYTRFDNNSYNSNLLLTYDYTPPQDLQKYHSLVRMKNQGAFSPDFVTTILHKKNFGMRDDKMES